MAEENPHEAHEAQEQPTLPDADAAPDVADAEAALDSVEQAVDAVTEAAGAEVQAPNLPDFAGMDETSGEETSGMSLLDDVSLRVKVELGRTMMYVEDVLRLNADSVIELDKAAGDPVDIYVNNRHVARGEVLVLNENFCVRVSEIIDTAAGEDETSS
jgi:flagellar motor switch protein FliN/FliY